MINGIKSDIALVQAQLKLYGSETESPPIRVDVSSTFAGNVALPIHRWFRYSAGFSALWARDLIEREKAKGRRTVLDPFAGSGTATLEAEAAGLMSLGIEAHPFVARIAQAKIQWRSDIKSFQSLSSRVLEYAEKHPVFAYDAPKLLLTCFHPTALGRLFSLREAWKKLSDDGAASKLVWLVLMSIVRECSPVGTAQWQYVLPNKSKARVADPFMAFASKSAMFARDMELRQRLTHGPCAEIRQEDARTTASLTEKWADLIVTSPPYANNYDYADATRLEMTFAGEINGYGELQKAVRGHLVRSCSQHVAPIRSTIDEILSETRLDPIRSEIVEVCRQLGIERLTHGGKKDYDTMIAAYFSDMAKIWRTLRWVSSSGSLVCFVVGDSAPYGVHVPVDRWLGELAVAAGFKAFRFEKTRDRNVKWKNRKHRVPLQEGRLWVEG